LASDGRTGYLAGVVIAVKVVTRLCVSLSRRLVSQFQHPELPTLMTLARRMEPTEGWIGGGKALQFRCQLCIGEIA